MKKAIAMVIATVLVLSLVGCSSGTSNTATQAATAAQATSQDTLVIDFCNVAPSDHPQNVAYRQFAEDVKKASNGRIEIRIFDNQQMGTITELTQGVIDGTFKMTCTSTSIMNSFDPGLSVFDLPYLFPSAEIGLEVLNGDIGERLMSKILSQGARCLGFIDNDFSAFDNNIHPITCPADLKGIKMRVSETPAMQAFVTACGGSPVVMASNEVYTSLQTNVIDGHDMGPILVWTGKYYEVLKYYTDTNHNFKVNALMVNEAWWQSLDPELRAILETECQKLVVNANKLCAEYRGQCLQGIIDDPGTEVYLLSDAEKAAFEEVGKSIWGQFSDTIDQTLFNDIQNKIKELSK